MELFLTFQRLFNITGFITGLLFFMMGFIILLQFQQYKHLSDLKIVKKIWLLGLFGLCQGLGQWAGAFVPLSLAPHVPGYLTFWFTFGEMLLNAVSYCALYWFAVEVLALVLGKDYYLRATAVFLSLLWLAIFSASFSPGSVSWLHGGLTWSRFLLALPGSILAALALNMQAKEFGRVGLPVLERNLYGAIASFCLYAVACGLHLPNAPLLTIFSGAWYSSLAGILRTIAGLGMAGFIIRVMEIFNVEHNKKLAAAQQREAILQERLRIGRDLHDGVIQSLYALGLSLEVASTTLDTAPAKAKEIIVNVMENLDRTIRDIRHFILDLTQPEESGLKWPDQLMNLIESFSASGIQVQLSYQVAENTISFDPQKAQELIYVFREALSNIARHSQARKASISIYQEGEELHIAIADDGRGFRPEEAWQEGGLSGRGLHNMAARVEGLGGEFHITSRPSQGTKIEMKIPLAALKRSFSR